MASFHGAYYEQLHTMIEQTDQVKGRDHRHGDVQYMIRLFCKVQLLDKQENNQQENVRNNKFVQPAYHDIIDPVSGVTCPFFYPPENDALYHLQYDPGENNAAKNNEVL